MRTLLFVLCITFTAALHADVVRPAPDFAWGAAGGQSRSLKSLRGQPVVLLIAESGRDGRFRKQVGILEEMFKFYSAREVIFVAALASEGEHLKSEIPFVLAQGGRGVAEAYGAGDRFSIVIIGSDGNIDHQTDEVLPADWVRTVIVNSFEAQKNIRQ